MLSLIHSLSQCDLLFVPSQASRCLMDQEKDQWASGSFKNKSLFCVTTVYGMYYE